MSGSQHTSSKVLSRHALAEQVRVWKLAGEQVILAKLGSNGTKLNLPVSRS